MTQPNIVLIVFDDMRLELLQSMPQLQKLALTGVSFTNGFCNTPLCQPARMTLLSGQYSHNHGVLDNDLIGYPIDHTSLVPARLQAVGYQTSHVGKYFNGWLIPNVIPAGWSDWHHLADVNDPINYFNYHINDNSVITQVGLAPADYNTTVCNNRALTFLAGATPPFFLQVAYKTPHPEGGWPAITPDYPYKGITSLSHLAPRNPNFNVPMGSPPPAYMQHAPMGTSDIANVDAFWRGQIEALYSADQSIKAIVAAAPANTVFIVTSDHGFMHGEGMDPASKMVPYTPSLRVPMIIAGPVGIIPAQSQLCSRLVSQADLAATIYALSGASATRTLDGLSLVPFLSNPQGPALRNGMLLEFLGSTGYPTANGGTGWGVKIPTWQSIVTQSALYTEYSTGEKELFDLVNDPWQLVNQTSFQAYRAIQVSMAAQLKNIKTCVGAGCQI